MNLLGNTLIIVSLVASLLSAVSYHRAAGSKLQVSRSARRWLRLSAASIVIASGLLLALFLQHDFSNGYVFSYSSRDLPLHFLISSFYAGQEGSFVFWILCSALIGLWLMSYTRKHKSEPWVMAVFMAVQTFLLLLVYAKTPFRTVWEMFPQAPAGQIPMDGRGLNPLLQNFWMVIHPPVLFIGFAAMAVPFSFAIASMWKMDWSLTSQQALGWLLFSVFVLGAGIMLGAYWAYGVLGWGGYWGWDPVENSSLVPWLTGVALVHTLVVQRRTGKLLRTNLTLAIVSFLLVVYSTFLTRSGVLGDSSVHAFVDPGAAVYWLLIVFLVAIAVAGFGLMYFRRAALRPSQTDNQFVSKETALAAGAIALVLSAAVILFGTSLPLMGKSTVDISFYNTMNLPLVIAMVLLIGLSLYMQWNNDEPGQVIKRMLKWLGVSLAVCAGLVVAGVSDTQVLAVIFVAAFTLLVNLEFGWKQGRVDSTAIGGKIAHIGLAIFLIGVLVSGKYNTTRQLALTLNQPVEALGHTLTYTGYIPTTDNKYAFNITVQDNTGTFVLSPLMFDGGEQGMMRNPDIASFATRDFYVSPISLQDDESAHAAHEQTYTIEKGKSIALGEFKATFVRFDMNAHSGDAMMSNGAMAVGSVLELSDGKNKETVTPVTEFGADGQRTFRPSQSKLLNATIQLVSMDVGGMGANVSAVTIGIHRHEGSATPSEALVVEASIKPFISLVWAGTIVMFAGFLMAVFKRLRTE